MSDIQVYNGEHKWRYQSKGLQKPTSKYVTSVRSCLPNSKKKMVVLLKSKIRSGFNILVNSPIGGRVIRFGFVLDRQDEHLKTAIAFDLGIRTLVTDTVMNTDEDRIRLAREVLEFATQEIDQKTPAHA